MNERIVSVEIAQRFLQTVRPRFEHEPPRGGARDHESELEGHVEPRTPPRELDARQIVHGARTLRDDGSQAVQAVLVLRQLEHASGRETKTSEVATYATSRSL